ncbi:hypothetical protein B0H17DRAFT_1217000 [Mycena rosella]|uniref:CxC2-like cysteine cluster KDZ transposase-associated domain-containing protein n=1 Tax=Mycena rosella TaxID=1033263 RepID=A0AAD7C2W9_MYCRO|nr:hypothetical protein B0H17DRAFT_1217000 [Mycena rosella]
MRCFHSIVVEGMALELTTLKELGLRIQLGHGFLNSCPDPVETDSFSIMDMAGIHDVSLDYCGCDTAASRGQQLKGARLYPVPWGGSSMINPDAAVTFELVRYYEEGLEEEEEGEASLVLTPVQAAPETAGRAAPVAEASAPEMPAAGPVRTVRAPRSTPLTAGRPPRLVLRYE